jgi:hypothetical protein
MIMDTRAFSPRRSLRLSAGLLLAGQLLYIVITQFHAGGDANNHPSIFAAYAANGIWTAVHVGQFVSAVILIAGLFALFFALDLRDGMATWWAGRFGAASATAALALYGVLQAVDGDALKQAVNAWASASETEKAARFANAEAIRWLEWGVRSYQDFALGLALLLFAVAVVRMAWASRPIAYLVQGWMLGSQGFSPIHSVAIVLAWVVSLVWMIWLGVVAWRMQDPAVSTEPGRLPGTLVRNSDEGRIQPLRLEFRRCAATPACLDGS